MNKKQAIQIIKSGKFFSALFLKKDGSIRKIQARSGVKKYLKPNAKPQSYSPSELGYICVWDMQIQNYRLINTQTIIQVNGRDING